MSLKQKYTWHDFLREHPEHKEKKTKRTSAEGKKAYDSAYKGHIKKYLQERFDKLGKSAERAMKKKDGVSLKLKEARKAGKKARAHVLERKLGTADRSVAMLTRLREKSKTAQKDF